MKTENTSSLVLPAQPRRSGRTSLLALLLLSAVAAAPQLPAAQRTWSGASDTLWGTAGNWGGTIPGAGDSLVFAGSTHITNYNNIASLSLTGISFNNSGFLFGGLLITNSGGIYDNAGNNTNNLVVYLNGSQGITNGVSGTVLVLGGLQTNLLGNTITFGGPGNIYVNGRFDGNAAASVYVNGDGSGNGLTRLAGNNTNFFGPITVNSGTLQLGNANGIGAARGDVTNNATIDLNGYSPTLNNLYGNSSGVVDNKAGTGTYTLTLGNTATNQGGWFEYDGVFQNTSGTLAWTKVNTNVFYLNGGGNTYGGKTTISAGKVILGASATIQSSSAIVVAQGAQLDVSQQSALSLGSSQYLYAGRNTNGGAGDILGSVDNSGTLVVLNPSVAGTLNITNNLTLESGSTVTFDLAPTNTVGAGSNDLITLNGTLTLNGGTIALNPYTGTFATGTYGTYTLITNSQALESGSAANMTIAVPRGVTPTLDDTTYPGSLLVHLAGSGIPVSLVWDGTSSSANWDVQQTQDWTNMVSGVADYFYFLDNVVFNDLGFTNVNVATGVSPSSTVFNNSPTNAYVLSGAGAISGSGSLSINNGGTVTLNTPNSYSGNTYVNYGQLYLGSWNTGSYANNQALYNGVTPATLVLGNGGLYIIDQVNTFFGEVFGGLTINPGGSSLSMRGRQSNSTTYSYTINSVPVRNVGGTLDLNSVQGKSGYSIGMYFPTASAVNGIMGGYSTFGESDWVNPVATGNGSTAYANYQSQANPTLWGAASNVVLSASPSANVTTTNINSLKLTGPSAITISSGNSLTLTSGGLLVPANAAGVSSITGGTLLGAAGADLIVLENSTADALTIASTIADNSSATALTKSGPGTLILTGANSYSGVTYINGATINEGSGTLPGLYAAGTLQVGAGGTVGDLGNTTTVTNYGTLAYNRSDNLTVGIPVNGPGGLKKLGANILTLTGANTYSGPTVISGGILQVGAGGTVGTLGSTSSVTNNATLVFNRSAATTVNGSINGSGTLIQMGNSVLTLTNVNLFYGPTIVSNGTVALGSAAALPNSAAIVLTAAGTTLDVSAISGGITLAGGAVGQVLAGYGTVNGSLTATNNTVVTPGTNGVVGTLTVNNSFTLAGGALVLDVGNSSKDSLAVGSALTLNSGVISLNTLNTLANGTYKLISYGSFGGAVANVSFAGFNQAGQLAYLTNNATAKEIDLVIYNGAGAYLTWIGDGGNNYWDVTTSANWNNGAGASDFHNTDNVLFNDSSANTTVNFNGSVAPASVTVNTMVNNYTFAGSGALVGGGSVVINATNTTVTVTAPFQNSGKTVVNTGTVQVGNGSTEGSLGTGVVTNNGTINFNEPNDTVFSGALAGSGNLVQSGSTTLTLNGNNSLYLGSVTVSSGVVDVGGNSASGTLGAGLVTNNGTLNIDRSGALTLNNNITGSGAVAFIGGGTVNFGGNNTYANNTYISNGIVRLGSSTALFSDGSAADWLVLDGSPTVAGTLDLNGKNVAVNALSGLNSTVTGTIEDDASSTTGTLSIIGSATTTYSGTIRDSSGGGGKVALFVGGAALQTIDVESAVGNTFTGGTVISNATVTLTSSRNGNSANYATPVCLGTGTINLMSNATLYAVGAYNQSEGPTWSSLANTITIAAGQTATIHGPQRGTMYGSIAGAGTLNYVTAYVRGAISGDWSGFTGQIIFSADPTGGQLGIANTNGLGKVLCTNTGSSGVTLYNTVAGTPTIPIGELADDGSAYIESTTSGNAGGVAANFAVGGLNTSVTFGGGIIDNVGIIKVGTGSWTLTNATLTYSGQTTVSNGMLVLGASATLPNSTPIAIQSPGILDVSAAGTFSLGASVAQTLEGTGTLNGSLSVGSSGTLSPGAAGTDSIGTLTVTNDVTLGGTALMELNRTNTPATNDMLVAKTIEAGGTLQVNNTGPDLHTGDTFKLFSVPVTGSFSTIVLPVTTADGSITYQWATNLAVDGTLKVLLGASGKATNPTNITATVNGSLLTLTWPTDHAGWYLQAQTNVLGAGLGTNWVDVSGSSSVTTEPITVVPGNPAVFYRLSLNP